MLLRKIDYDSVRGKYVLLRDDFNVQIENGKIVDSFRIDASMPTIKHLISNGARVVICAHLGRPKGKHDDSLSLRPIAEYMNIPFIDDCLKKDFLRDMKNGDLVLMENLRFYKGEEENDDSFAKKLAEGFDIYVNDAFAVSHRAAASTVGITKYLPSFAGDLLVSEIENISNVMEKPEHPFIAFVGGAKVSSKIGVLKKLVTIADKVVVGGAMGTTFNFAFGAPVGNSLYEPEMADTVMEIMNIAKQNGCEVLLPLDKGVGKTFDKNAKRENRDVDKIKDDDVIIDDGDKTIARNHEVLENAKTVVWNGTFGMAEWGDVWGKSSFALARDLAHFTKIGKIKSIVGGGETVAALDAIGVHKDMTYVSTGGGAFLEFIEGKELPGIAALEK
ncbi:MAG: phosphoglycerate kinase [Alphaproteobacteria bacterium]|nr:phosphoglycerate kinase [Alphaproteobacteria bacterium]